MARAAGMMLLAVLVLLTANVSAWSIPLGQSSRDGRIESFGSETAVTPEIEQLLDETTVGKNMEEDAGITNIITPLVRKNEKLHFETLPSSKQRIFEGVNGNNNRRKRKSGFTLELVSHLLVIDRKATFTKKYSLSYGESSTDLKVNQSAVTESFLGDLNIYVRNGTHVTRKLPGSKSFRKNGYVRKSEPIEPRSQSEFHESGNKGTSKSIKPQCSTAGLCETTRKKCKTSTCSTEQPCEPTAAPITPDLCGTTEAPEEENCGTTEAPGKENCEKTKNPCEKTGDPCDSTKSSCATKKPPKFVPWRFPGSKKLQKSGSFMKNKLIRPRLHQQNSFDGSDNRKISGSMKPECSTEELCMYIMQGGLCRTAKKKCKTSTCSTEQPCEPTAASITPDLCGTTKAPEEENCETTQAPGKENCETIGEPCGSTKSSCTTRIASSSVTRKFHSSKIFQKSGSFGKSKQIERRLHEKNEFKGSDNNGISRIMKPQCSTAGLCETTKKKCKTSTCSTEQPCEPTAAPITPDLCGTTEAPEEENCGTTEAPGKENCEETKNPCEKTGDPCDSTKKAPKFVPSRFPGSKKLQKSGSFMKNKLIRPRLHQQNSFDGSDNRKISESMKPQCSTEELCMYIMQGGLCRTAKKKCKTSTCSTEQPCEPTAASITPDLCGTTKAPEEENCETTQAPGKENCETIGEPCGSTKSSCTTRIPSSSVTRKFHSSKNFQKSGSFGKSKQIERRLHKKNKLNGSDNNGISKIMKPQCSTEGLCETTKKKCRTSTCSTEQPCEPTAAPITPDLCGTTGAPEEENCGTTEAPRKQNCEKIKNPCEKTGDPCDSTKKAPKFVPSRFPGSKKLQKSGSFMGNKLIRPRLHQQNSFDRSDNRKISESMKPQCSTEELCMYIMQGGLCRTAKNKCRTSTCSTEQPCEPTAAPVTPDLCGTTEALEEENCGTTEAPRKQNCEKIKNPCGKTGDPCDSTKSSFATKKASTFVPRKFPGSKNFRKTGSLRRSKLIKPCLHQQNALDQCYNTEISRRIKPHRRTEGLRMYVMEGGLCRTAKKEVKSLQEGLMSRLHEQNALDKSDNNEISGIMKPQCLTAGLYKTTEKKFKTSTCPTEQPLGSHPTAAPFVADEENCGTIEAPEKESWETT